MPIHVTWYETEKRHIVYRFLGTWSWEECHAALVQAAVLLDEIDYPVHQIVDLRKTVYAPHTKYESLSYIAQAAAPNHPNSKKVFVIGLRGPVLVSFNVFKHVFPQAASHYLVVNDDTELEELLKPARTVG